MRSKLLAVLVIAAFAISLAPATVAEAWEKGKMKVITTGEVAGQYDSNVFYDPDDEKHDWIGIIRAGIAPEVGFGAEGKHKLSGNYMFEGGVFSEYDDQNYGNHDLFGELFLDFNKWSITANDRFLFTSSRAGTEFARRTLRKENTVRTILGLHMNKFDFDFGYENYLITYHSDSLRQLDHYDNSAFVTGYYKVTEKTKALLDYKYTYIDYRHADGRNANVNRVMAGAQGQLAPKVTGIAKAGFKSKKYQDSNNKDFDGFVAYVALSYDPSERWNILASYEREPFESTYTQNNYYTGDHVTGAITYKFHEKWKAIADGQYFYNNYPEYNNVDNLERTDHIWSAGGKLEYTWKEMITLAAGYRFKQRESNLNSRDYDDHLVEASIKAMF